MESIPEFYTGAPVDPVDLRFRETFLAELWQTLRTGHVVLTAPRRTGKTSVMDYLREHPENGFSVVSISVQDLTHPADFFQVLLDGFHDAHPDFVRDRLAAGWELVSGVVGKVDEIGVGGFKLGLRESDPDWRTNWRQHGDTFLAQARKTDARILFIIDEFPDMLLSLSRENEGLLRQFLAWFRNQRQNPAPARDSIRGLIGGSVNLAGTLDALGLVDLINDLEDVSLPPLTDGDIETFVKEMLGGRGVPFDDDVPQRLTALPGSSDLPLHADGDPGSATGCGNGRNAGSPRGTWIPSWMRWSSVPPHATNCSTSIRGSTSTMRIRNARLPMPCWDRSA